MSPADLPVRITIDVDGSGGTDMIKRHPLVIFKVLVVIIGPILVRFQLKPTDAEKGDDRGMRSG